MEKLKYEEEHVECTLHTGNQLKILNEEFCLGMEEDTLTVATQEPAQQKLVYITNLEEDS